MRGGLVRNGWKDTFALAARATLKQPSWLLAHIDGHGAVKDGSVEPPFIDITQNIGRRNRRALGFKRDSDVSKARLQHDVDCFELRIGSGRVGDKRDGAGRGLDLEFEDQRVLTIGAGRLEAIVKIVIRGDVEKAPPLNLAQRQTFEIVEREWLVEGGEGFRLAAYTRNLFYGGSVAIACFVTAREEVACAVTRAGSVSRTATVFLNRGRRVRRTYGDDFASDPLTETPFFTLDEAFWECRKCLNALVCAKPPPIIVFSVDLIEVIERFARRAVQLLISPNPVVLLESYEPAAFRVTRDRLSVGLTLLLNRFAIQSMQPVHLDRVYVRELAARFIRHDLQPAPVIADRPQRATAIVVLIIDPFEA